MARKIPLTQGEVALVDNCDYERVISAGKWHVVKSNSNNWYAERFVPNGDGTYKRLLLHRFILGIEDGVLVDHVDGNGLNCTRKNMRECNKSENGMNRKKQSNNKSGFRGVSWQSARGKWKAQVQTNGKNYYLGLFDTAEDAYKAYSKLAKELFGKFYTER